MSRETEEGVVGCMLYDPATIPGIGLSPEDFEDYRLSLLYRAVTALYEETGTASLELLPKFCGGSLRAVGGVAMVAELARDSIVSAALPQYVESVRRDAAYRRIGKAAESALSAITRGCGREAAVADLTASIEDRESSGANNSLPIGSVAEQRYREIRDGKPAGSGVPMMFPGLGRYSSSLPRLTLVGGRPGTGKTAVGLQLGTALGMDGFVGVYWSGEMDKADLVNRQLAAYSGIDHFKVRDAKLTASEQDRIRDAWGTLASATLILDDTRVMSAAGLWSLVSRCRRNHGKCDALIIDYLQLLKADNPSRRGDDRADLERVSKEVVSLAKSLGVPVVALVQLNRAAGETKPRLHHLRGSGVLEQDADIVCLLCANDSDFGKLQLPVEMTVEKNRGGETGTVKLVFNRPLQTFKQLETRQEDRYA